MIYEMHSELLFVDNFLHNMLLFHKWLAKPLYHVAIPTDVLLLSLVYEAKHVSNV